MRIGAAYIRVSTDDQTEYSPDSQLRLIKEYAKRNDILIPEEFIFLEDGQSGRTTRKRPTFLSMIGVAKQTPKPFDCILVYALSRFARNREDSVVYKRMLRKDLGIDVISITQDFGDDKTAILIEALLEAMDEYYSIDLGENVKRGMTEKAHRGEPLSIAPMGYKMVDKNLVVDPDTAPIIKMIFEDFAAGTPYRELAQKVNDMGVRTRRGNFFANRTVEYILRNPSYIGKIRWNPTERTQRDFDHPDLMIVDGHHEPIIDHALWEVVQERILQLKKMYQPHSRIRSAADYMLRGLVRCSACGATLVHSSAGVSLQCHNYSRGSCNVSHSMTIKKLDALVLAGLEATLSGADFVVTERTLEKTAQEQVERLQIDREYQKLLRVKEAYEAGIDTLDEYRANKEKITARIAQLEAAPAQPVIDSKAVLIDRLKNAMDVLRADDSSPSEKNALLRTFVDKIVLQRPEGKLQIFYYV